MHLEHELILINETRATLTDLTSTLSASAGNAGIVPAAREFVACFDELPPYSDYKHIPTGARERHKKICEHCGPDTSRQFLFACVLLALLDSLESEAFARLPNRIRHHQVKQFRRIVDNAASITAACDIDSDLFHKDFGLASMRLYAAAAQVVDFRTGIGRVTLVRGGLRDLPWRLAIFLKMGGFKPFFQIHTHLAYLDEFNEEGWNECYRCCAELYAVHPEVLGMFGCSWFYDPALAALSPRLSYLREVPQQGGSYCLFDSVDEQSIQDATATSPTRKALYKEGKYMPKRYALIWPRAAQIDWYCRQDAQANSA